MASTQQFEDPNAQNTDSVLSDSTHSPNIVKEKKESDIPVSHRLDLELKELFAENVVAKIWNVALRLLKEQVLYCTSSIPILPPPRQIPH
jgi:hypothetical protein